MDWESRFREIEARATTMRPPAEAGFGPRVDVPTVGDGNPPFTGRCKHHNVTWFADGSLPCPMCQDEATRPASEGATIARAIGQSSGRQHDDSPISGARRWVP